MIDIGGGIQKSKRRGLEASLEKIGEVVVIRLEGRISIDGGDVSLRDIVRDLLGRGERKLLLDMSKVSFVDSSGIGELVAAWYSAKNRGAAVRLCCLSDRVFDILRLVELFRVFDVSLDREGGLAAFASEDSA